jgi:hypothetical protein
MLQESLGAAIVSGCVHCKVALSLTWRAFGLSFDGRNQFGAIVCENDL